MGTTGMAPTGPIGHGLEGDANYKKKEKLV